MPVYVLTIDLFLSPRANIAPVGFLASRNEMNIDSLATGSKILTIHALEE